MRARILPNRNVVKKSQLAISTTNEQYLQFLEDSDYVDDVDYLADLLNENFNTQGLEILWAVQEGEEGEDESFAIDWYIHSGSTYHSGEILILLHPKSIIDYWGPITFQNIAMKTIEHEAIHLQQRKKMGIRKYKKVKSGYEKGMVIFERTQDAKKLLTTYMQDPQEIQAHGHDLYREISILLDNDKEILSNIEHYKDELPTYYKYRTVFELGSKTIKRLLKYTFQFYMHYK